jgi:hypothetical protein
MVRVFLRRILVFWCLVSVHMCVVWHQRGAAIRYTASASLVSEASQVARRGTYLGAFHGGEFYRSLLLSLGSRALGLRLGGRELDALAGLTLELEIVASACRIMGSYGDERLRLACVDIADNRR